jgi:hypothetical protein
MALSPAVNILDIICRRLEMAGRVIALGDVNIIVDTTLQRLVDWNWWAHELLLDSSESLEARCEFEVVVCVGLGDSGDNGDVVAFRTDAVGA